MKNMMWCVAALCFAASACGESSGDARVDRIAALTGSTTAGKAKYDALCASCHGTDGKGLTDMVKTDAGTMTVAYPTLVEPLANDTKAHVLTVILYGVKDDAGVQTEMVGNEGLRDQDIADIYAYMKATFK